MIDHVLCIIAGMPRASTTFLYHTLAGHPSIFVPARKEIEFFSLNFHRGVSWYEAFFSTIEPGQVGFDISPLYFFDPQAPTRIAELRPEAIIALIIRRPSDFAVSFYNNRISSGTLKSTFEAYLEGFSYRKDGSSLAVDLTPGSISAAIRRFRSVFGRRLLVADYRSVEKDPLDILQAIEKHIGVTPHFTAMNFKNVRINSSNQINIRLFNFLMHQRWFADSVTRFFPKKFIMSIRYLLQTTTQNSPNSTGENWLQETIMKSREHFVEDDAYVEKMFRENGPIFIDDSK